MADKTKTPQQKEAEKERRAKVQNTKGFKLFAVNYGLTETGKKQLSNSRTLYSIATRNGNLTYEDIENYWLKNPKISKDPTYQKSIHKKEVKPLTTSLKKSVEKASKIVEVKPVEKALEQVQVKPVATSVKKPLEQVEVNPQKVLDIFFKSYGVNATGRKKMMNDNRVKELLKKGNTYPGLYFDILYSYSQNKSLHNISNPIHKDNRHEIFYPFIDDLEEDNTVINIDTINNCLSKTFIPFVNKKEEEKIFANIGIYKLYKWFTFGNSNDCLIHAFFTVTSEKYRQLSRYDRVHAVSEFRRVTLPKLLSHNYHHLIKLPVKLRDSEHERDKTIKLLESNDFLDDSIINLLAELFNVQIVLFEHSASSPGENTLTRINVKSNTLYFLYNDGNNHFSAISLEYEYILENIWYFETAGEDDEFLIELYKWAPP